MSPKPITMITRWIDPALTIRRTFPPHTRASDAVATMANEMRKVLKRKAGLALEKKDIALMDEAPIVSQTLQDYPLRTFSFSPSPFASKGASFKVATTLPDKAYAVKSPEGDVIRESLIAQLRNSEADNAKLVDAVATYERGSAILKQENKDLRAKRNKQLRKIEKLHAEIIPLWRRTFVDGIRNDLKTPYKTWQEFIASTPNPMHTLSIRAPSLSPKTLELLISNDLRGAGNMAAHRPITKEEARDVVVASPKKFWVILRELFTHKYGEVWKGRS